MSTRTRASAVTPPATQKWVASYAYGNNPTANATTWWCPIGCLVRFVLEPRAQIHVPQAATIRNLRVYCDATTATQTVVTLNVNGVASALTITIPAGAPEAEYSDLVNVVNVVAGDLISVAVTCAATPPTFWRLEMDYRPT